MLFGTGPSSRFSPDGRHRYWLLRRWDSRPSLAVIGLNPSTADAAKDDNTIRLCIDLATRHAFGAMEMLNLYAWRATEPDDMFAALARREDIIGQDNDRTIAEVTRSAGLVAAAWGADGRAAYRAEWVLAMLSQICDVYFLAKTGGNCPHHPLYLPKDIVPTLYQAKAS